MFKIKYLFHSGFLVETEDRIIVFDYFEDNCKKKSAFDCGRLKSEDFSNDKKVVFFVSHAHYDHFDKEIFKLHNNAKYVISNDLRIAKNESIMLCAPYEKFEIDGLKVETFGSTDEGLSFLVEIEGKKIFHAGDLNWWHWEGETEDEKENAKNSFFREVERIIGTKIDIAFFPVDPRLEDAYFYGGKYFIEKVSPKVFIPMHFQDCYYITQKFKNYVEEESKFTKVLTIEKRGQVLEF